LGHTRYYRKFIKGYAHITTPMEKLLKKEYKIQWNENFHKGLNTLKKKLVNAPILIFPYWKNEFHVHMDASSPALVVILYHPRGESLMSTLEASLVENSGSPEGMVMEPTVDRGIKT
jgi:hypothetical protein